MDSCLYNGLALVGLFNHQSEKSVQTEPTAFLETYFVKDFFDTKQNLCFERFNVKGESLNITKNDKPTIEDFIQKTDSICNGIDLSLFEDQVKTHLNSFKSLDQTTSNDITHQISEEKKNLKSGNKQKLSDFTNTKYIKVDLKEKRYKCENCNKRFVNSSDFKRHLKIHTDEKLYICTICAKGKYL